MSALDLLDSCILVVFFAFWFLFLSVHFLLGLLGGHRLLLWEDFQGLLSQNVLDVFLEVLDIRLILGVRLHLVILCFTSGA